MIQDMTMKEPVPTLGGGKFKCICLHRHDVHGIFQGRMIALPVEQAEEMSMQMHGMPHHRPIVKNDPHILSFSDQYPIRLGNSLVVDGPDITVHIARKIEPQLFHRSIRQSCLYRTAQHPIVEGDAGGLPVHHGVHIHLLIAHLHLHAVHIPIPFHHVIHHLHTIKITQPG